MLDADLVILKVKRNLKSKAKLPIKREAAVSQNEPAHRRPYSQESSKLQGIVLAKTEISLHCPSKGVCSKHRVCASRCFVTDRRILLSEAGVYGLTFLKRNLETFPDTASAPSPCTSEYKASKGNSEDD